MHVRILPKKARSICRLIPMDTLRILILATWNREQFDHFCNLTFEASQRMIKVIQHRLTSSSRFRLKFLSSTQDFTRFDALQADKMEVQLSTHLDQI
jgi:hypothetical protein